MPKYTKPTIDPEKSKLAKPTFDPESILGNDSNGDAVANDNGTGAEAKAPTVPALKSSTALASIEALGAMIGNIDTTGYGSSTKPMLNYKSRENIWQFGQQRKIPENGVAWIVNIASAGHGYVCFDAANNNKPTSKMTPAHMPMPNLADLPDLGSKWNEQRSFELKCLEETDRGIEVEYRTTTVGGIQAFKDLIEQVKARFASGRHEGKLFPIVLLDQSSYPHSEFGRINYPVFTVVDWATAEGPEPEPVSAPQPPSKSPPSGTTASEQPRRRRVA